MKRTIKEWLEYIADEEVRKKALGYMRTDPNRFDNFLSENIEDALKCAFDFDNTNEGILYWWDIATSNIELLPFND